MSRRISLCKNCYFFNRSKNNDDYQSSHYGVCKCPKFVYGYSTKNDKDYSKLYYLDYEGYSASFEVGENFGCVHFLNKASDFNE